jgi:hypothetical protein
LLFKALADNQTPGDSRAITEPGRLKHFYGRDNEPRVRYVREKKRLEYGKAHEDEYSLELLE